MSSNWHCTLKASGSTLFFPFCRGKLRHLKTIKQSGHNVSWWKGAGGSQMSMRIKWRRPRWGEKRGMGLCSWWFSVFFEVLYTVRSHCSLWARYKVHIVLKNKKNNRHNEPYKRTISLYSHMMGVKSKLIKKSIYMPDSCLFLIFQVFLWNAKLKSYCYGQISNLAHYNSVVLLAGPLSFR